MCMLKAIKIPEGASYKELKYLCGFYERDNREGGHLDFIPDVVEIATGNRIDRHALESQTPDNIIALPVFGTEASS